MEVKRVKISELKYNSIQHSTLPKKLIERIKLFKGILAEVETSSLEETITNFKRDLYPENEIRIWEKITKYYQSFITENKIEDLAIQKEVFKTILATSMGAN